MSVRTDRITHQAPHSLTLPPSLKTLQLTLEQAGWEVLALDIDGVDGRFNFVLKRWDGPDDHLLVTVRADRLGRCSITREAAHRRVERTRGVVEVYVRENERITLLGRDTYPGLLAGLKTLAVYVEDNSPRALPAGALRAEIAGVYRQRARAISDGAVVSGG